MFLCLSVLCAASHASHALLRHPQELHPSVADFTSIADNSFPVSAALFAFLMALGHVCSGLVCSGTEADSVRRCC